MVVEAIRDILFKRAPQKIQLCSMSERKTGMVGAAGICSELRPEGVSVAKAKYNVAALALDKIIAEKCVEAYSNDGSVYVKFTAGSQYHAVYDGECCNWNGDIPDLNEYKLLPLVIYALVKAGDDITKSLRKDFDDIVKGENVDEAVLRFCDGFYYGFVVEEMHSNVRFGDTGFDEELLENAIATGVFTPIDFIAALKPHSAKVEEDETVPEPEAVEETFSVVYDGWSEEQKGKIPGTGTLDTYIQTDETTAIAKKIKFRLTKVLERMNSGESGADAIKGDYVNVLLVGRPATGKTSLANAVAAMTGLPIYEIPFSKNTEEDTIEGKNKVVNGRIDFVETEFLKAYEHGGIIVCEEINLADPAVVMGALGQAIEPPFIVMKDGYIPVRRHPLCVIIGTMNTGTAGSRMLNQALSSRFKSTYILDDPTEETFVKILETRGFQKKNCKYVYNAYCKIMDYLKDPKNASEDLCENITLRSCFGALESMEEGQPPKKAIETSLVGKIGEVRLDAAKDVIRNVVDSLPELGATRTTSRSRLSSRAMR